MKTMRKSVYRARLEAQLHKYERRIQRMAENAYKVRQVIENMIRQEAQDAVSDPERQNGSGNPTTGDIGGVELRDNAPLETVLGEQPEKLSVDK